eukprot:TRINITY_DN1249_c0_g2_i1.p1 TRINITY_DN1249_c0_g2~~TRINITY_DN1249_c0_g2_i1.p1  ORF type:complete len:347 (+),score=121.51 TRINITY_DN1249_c0_g2_i1:64-1104(+)
MAGASPNTGRLTHEDLLVFAMNVVTCVSIVMVNKQLMSKAGYAFLFATTLSGAHFVITGVATRVMRRWKEGSQAVSTEKKSLPLMDLITFVVIANTSLVSLNVSLMVNKVSMYQIAKLAIPVITAVVERFWFGSSYSGAQYIAMLVTLIGISNVGADELKVGGDGYFGVIVAAVSAVSSSFQQILCGYYQRKNNMSSQEFLSAVSFPQGLSCLFLGPMIDYWLTGQHVLYYNYTSASVFFIFLSCFNAIFVNASHFMCLGRFSAVTYQVLGHTKTVGVLYLGWMFFDGNLTEKQMMGGAMAVAGMASYGYITQTKKQVKPVEKADTDDVEAGRTIQGSPKTRITSG